MKTYANPAEDYARTIAEEVLALDDLIGSTDRDTIAAALKTLEMDPDTDPPDALIVWINETALELSILRDTRPDMDRARVEILRTCGGPRCEIHRDTFDGTAVTVEVWDGSDHYAHRMNPDNFAGWLDELAGE